MQRTSTYLSLSKLEAFVAICEGGSLSKAAERLSLAQPALTSMIRKMESELNVKLLDRHSKGSTPTKEGKILLKSAYEILGIANSTLQEIGSLSQTATGKISIGIPAAISAVLTEPLIKSISTHLPDVRLKIVEAFSGYLWDLLIKNELDIAICYDRVSIPEVVCQPLCFEELFLIGAKGLFIENTEYITQDKIKNYPLLLPSRIHGVRQKIENYSALSGGLNVKMEIDSSYHLVEMIKRGEGFGLLAKCAIYDSLLNNALVALPLQPSITREVSLGILRSKVNSPLVKKILMNIYEVSNELFDDKWPILHNSILIK